MTPWPLELSTPLPPKISTASVLFSSVSFSIPCKLGTNATTSILSNTDDPKALQGKTGHHQARQQTQALGCC